MAAGLDTSSTHVSTVVYLMALHPDKTAKLYEVCTLAREESMGSGWCKGLLFP